MELRPLRFTDRSLELRLVDEDFSVADVTRTELLNLKHVVFAGVMSPHPLLREVVLRVETAEGDPLKVLTAAAEGAHERAQEFLAAATHLFGKSEGAKS